MVKTDILSVSDQMGDVTSNIPYKLQYRKENANENLTAEKDSRITNVLESKKEPSKKSTGGFLFFFFFIVRKLCGDFIKLKPTMS